MNRTVSAFRETLISTEGDRQTNKKLYCDESLKSVFEQEKPDIKEQILCDFFFLYGIKEQAEIIHANVSQNNGCVWED